MFKGSFIRTDEGIIVNIFHDEELVYSQLITKRVSQEQVEKIKTKLIWLLKGHDPVEAVRIELSQYK